ncbi:MAG: acetate kinase [Desulfovibrionaceae bacterium]|nr:acetate kinase [Desulfovibrionaceae bacterium]
MKVLVVNAGSSSLKYQFINLTTCHCLCSGLVERIGQESGHLTHKRLPDTPHRVVKKEEHQFADHAEAMKRVSALLTDSEYGVIQDISEIYAIGHRVLHGGEEITHPVIVDEHVKNVIRRCFPLGPLHNPANLTGIEVSEKMFPGIPNVAVFDTEFGMSMPPSSYMYPLPYELYEQYGIRRYGFHGTSHNYVASRTAEFLGKSRDELNAVILHLGNGASASAVRNGSCLDTTMGLTPLEGLMMGTRCGTIDPAIVPFLMQKTGMSAAEIDTIMNRKSGLLGICGINDMRDVKDAVKKGEPRAVLALDMFVHRIKKTLGAYMAVLGRTDAVVFTAGIGENDDSMRSRVCANMDFFGIKLDEEANAGRGDGPRRISTPDSRVSVLVIPTNEELSIAMETYRVVHEH